jgi:hypothetical protein
VHPRLQSGACVRPLNFTVRPDVTSDRPRRVANLGAWVGGAVATLLALLAILSLFDSDPAWGGVFGVFFFGGIFGLASIFCGLVGYALCAGFRPSSATPGATALAGVIAAILMLLATYFLMPLGPGVVRPIAAGVISAAVGATSYAVANRVRSNNRWRVRDA